jgi:hypothetical protein
MPRRLMAEFVHSEPSLESIRSIAQLCGTSLTASAVRLITLTPQPSRSGVVPGPKDPMVEAIRGICTLDTKR